MREEKTEELPRRGRTLRWKIRGRAGRTEGEGDGVTREM